MDPKYSNNLYTNSYNALCVIIQITYWNVGKHKDGKYTVLVKYIGGGGMTHFNFATLFSGQKNKCYIKNNMNKCIF